MSIVTIKAADVDTTVIAPDEVSKESKTINVDRLAMKGWTTITVREMRESVANAGKPAKEDSRSK